MSAIYCSLLRLQGKSLGLLFKTEHFFFVCLLFRAVPTAYGSSQARGRIRAELPAYTTVTALDLSRICRTAHSNAGSLTLWARSGIKPSSSWILVGFISTEPRWELPQQFLKLSFFDKYLLDLRSVSGTELDPEKLAIVNKTEMGPALREIIF